MTISQLYTEGISAALTKPAILLAYYLGLRPSRTSVYPQPVLRSFTVAIGVRILKRLTRPSRKSLIVEVRRRVFSISISSLEYHLRVLPRRVVSITTLISFLLYYLIISLTRLLKSQTFLQTIVFPDVTTSPSPSAEGSKYLISSSFIFQGCPELLNPVGPRSPYSPRSPSGPGVFGFLSIYS